VALSDGCFFDQYVCDIVAVCRSVRSLEALSSTVNDDDEQSAAATTGLVSSAVDERTSDLQSHSVNSCSAGARDSLTTDGSEVLAVPT